MTPIKIRVAPRPLLCKLCGCPVSPSVPAYLRVIDLCSRRCARIKAGKEQAKEAGK